MVLGVFTPGGLVPGGFHPGGFIPWRIHSQEDSFPGEFDPIYKMLVRAINPTLFTGDFLLIRIFTFAYFHISTL